MPRPALTIRRSHTSALLAGLGLLILTGCFPFSGPVSKDYSDFTRYSYAQTPGLGFCGDANGVFAARIDRASDGAMTYTATLLKPNGKSYDDCGEDDLATEDGCMTPAEQPPRPLSTAEAGRVASAFKAVTVLRKPEKICRTIAIDPCRIDRHSWDDASHSDYVCGADRLDADQSKSLSDLMTSLSET